MRHNLLLWRQRRSNVAGGRSRAPPRTCSMTCYDGQIRCWPFSTTYLCPLRTILRKGIFAWSKCNKRSPERFAAMAERPPFVASGVIFRRCTSRDILCWLRWLLFLQASHCPSLGHLCSYKYILFHINILSHIIAK